MQIIRDLVSNTEFDDIRVQKGVKVSEVCEEEGGAENCAKWAEIFTKATFRNLSTSLAGRQ